MIHVIATAHIVKGHRQEFLDEFNANVPNVLAEKGCIQYTPTVDLVSGIDHQIPPEEDTVVIIEQWETIEDLNNHIPVELLKCVTFYHSYWKSPPANVTPFIAAWSKRVAVPRKNRERRC